MVVIQINSKNIEWGKIEQILLEDLKDIKNESVKIMEMYQKKVINSELEEKIQKMLIHCQFFKENMLDIEVAFLDNLKVDENIKILNRKNDVINSIIENIAINVGQLKWNELYYESKMVKPIAEIEEEINIKISLLKDTKENENVKNALILKKEKEKIKLYKKAIKDKEKFAKKYVKDLIQSGIKEMKELIKNANNSMEQGINKGEIDA